MMDFEEIGEVPPYLKEKVKIQLQNHGAPSSGRATLAGFIVDEDEEEFLLQYTDTDATREV